MRILGCVALCAALGGCAYKAEPIAAPSYNVVTSFSNKVPGKWILATEAAPLNQVIKPSGPACSAHNFPVELEAAFTTSVSETVRNVFEQIEDVSQPIPGDQVRKRGARGMIVVRGEELRARLDVQPGFWSANMKTQAMVVASVYVDGPNGRMFGQTVEGQGSGDADGGAFCNGGAKSMTDSAATATRDTVRKIAEALGNSERLRSAK
jgi:hypothetical protein